MKPDAKQTLIPKLRFPEFRKDGEWCHVYLQNICDLITKGTTPTSYGFHYVESGIRFVKIESLNDGSVDVSKTAFITSECHQLFERSQLQTNDILFSIAGALGVVASVSEDILPANTNQALAIIRLTPSNSWHYIFFYLCAPMIQTEIFRIKAGAAQPNISLSQLGNFQILLPPLVEQQKIADCLSTLDERIGAESRKLDALKTHKKGIMQQLFPREGETLPPLRFPEFKNAPEWKKSPLSKFFLSLDAGVSVNSGDRPAAKGKLGILKTSAVTNEIFDPSENKVVSSELEQARLTEPVLADTIIISRMNTPLLVGANAYVATSDSNLFLPDRLWAAKPRENVSMRFLAFVLGSDKGRSALAMLATGTSGSMKNITKPDVLRLPIMAPNPDEQRRIAFCLSSLDNLITAQSEKLETLKNHKKALMQQLFPFPKEVNA